MCLCFGWSVCLSICLFFVRLCVSACLSVCAFVLSVSVSVSVCLWCVCCLFCFLLCGRVYCLPVVCCLPLSSMRTDTKKAGFLPRSLSVCLWLFVRVCKTVPQSVVFVRRWNTVYIPANAQTLKFCTPTIFYQCVDKLNYSRYCNA